MSMAIQADGTFSTSGRHTAVRLLRFETTSSNLTFPNAAELMLTCVSEPHVIDKRGKACCCNAHIV